MWLARVVPPTRVFELRGACFLGVLRCCQVLIRMVTVSRVFGYAWVGSGHPCGEWKRWKSLEHRNPLDLNDPAEGKHESAQGPVVRRTENRSSLMAAWLTSCLIHPGSLTSGVECAWKCLGGCDAKAKELLRLLLSPW